LLKRLQNDAISVFTAEGLPMHVPHTSPASEVVDVTLPTTLASVTGASYLAGRILYLSNQESKPSVIYHPTVIGVDFLDKIGATVQVGARKR
jgi:hypothetical protein